MNDSPRLSWATLAAVAVTGWPLAAYGQSAPAEEPSEARQAEATENARTIGAARERQRMMLGTKREDIRDPNRRARLVQRVREAENEHRNAVHARAKMKGLATRGQRAGGVEFVLVDFDENDLPVYVQTENENAAISTATDQVRSNASYAGVDGSSVTIGLWEASGVPLTSHQEFSGRITVGDSSTSISGHATHVAGTLAAAGVRSDAEGMAPAAKITAFGVSGYQSEILDNGADAPGTTKLYVSNHSYGTGQGWEDDRWSGTFVDDGNPATNYESDFGRYSSTSEIWDDLSYALPYHLMFISAGNQRNDDAPEDGESWTYGGDTYTYDSSQHPLGDGDYKGGWDNLEGRKISKNAIAVGNTADAVSGGVRDAERAVTRRSSSRGPTDDGRIKPDIVANGDSLYSSESTGNAAYGNRSGTSMAAPNASGSAALLIEYYSTRFPGGAMRASTLKALILHTADDDGNPGPDYRYGWGLMNTKAAVDVIRDYADNAGGSHIMESSVDDSSTPSRTHSFAWNGSSPLRVTLCWTDPPGIEKEGHDNREKALVNDLNLRVTGPTGTHFPYVMPHVGNWSTASIDDDARTGINGVDPIEQVYLASPVAGLYTIEVDYDGPLTNSSQDYSLIVTGQTAAEISVAYDGPPGAILADGLGTQDFGPAAPSQAPLTRAYTITNSGGNPLTGLALSRSGSHVGDFTPSALSATELQAGESANFTISFDPQGPGARTASVQIASNDADESTFDILLAATGLTELEAWRLTHFGTTSNSGDAADDFDFDNDRMSNLIEFALATDPRSPDPEPSWFETDATNATLTYLRNVDAVAFYDFQVTWSDDLNDEIWRTDSVTEEIISDDGTVQRVRASIPIGNTTKRFFRLSISPK